MAKLKTFETTTNAIKNSVVDDRIKLDNYYVVVGFEVNYPQAFIDNTHDLAIDYGHAFFYIVKNHVVIKLFSFGPKGAGKIGWFDGGNPITPNKYNTGAVIKDGYKDSRPATSNYEISEKIKIFKVPLNILQGIKLEAETKRVEHAIVAGQQKYTAFLNDTCSETARDILTSAGIETPNGSGKVKHSGIVNFPMAYAENPYMWEHNFEKSAFESREYIPRGKDNEWLPIGGVDVIFKEIK